MRDSNESPAGATAPQQHEVLAEIARQIEEHCRLKRWPELQTDVALFCERASAIDGDRPEKPAARVLGSLRKRRRFEQMQQVSEHLLDSGWTAPLVQRQLVQAYIDQGLLADAEPTLSELLRATADAPGSNEWVEARGLLGRLRKQAYVEARRAGREGRAVNLLLQQAVAAYRQAWEYGSEDRAAYERANHWPGINLVACAARAERDGLKLASLPDWRDLAARILGHIQPDWKAGDTWSAASALEACIALQLGAQATDDWLVKYLDSPNTDAFELASISRQLQEVWQFEPSQSSPGSILGTLLGRHARVEEVDLVTSPRDLQGVHGFEGYVPARWVQELHRSFGAVARIEHGSRPIGTGFVVDGAELHENLQGHRVALTNQHVVSENRYGDMAIKPEQARLRFPDERVRRVKQQLWPPAHHEEQLDVSILQIDESEPLERVLLVMQLKYLNCERNPPPRLYVIGYPKGGELAVSLYDNRFVRANPPSILYRSPTAHGHSGSPVMDENFDVVAVHFAESKPDQANEGVLIDSVRERLAQLPPTRPTSTSGGTK